MPIFSSGAIIYFDFIVYEIEKQRSNLKCTITTTAKEALTAALVDLLQKPFCGRPCSDFVSMCLQMFEQKKLLSFRIYDLIQVN